MTIAQQTQDIKDFVAALESASSTLKTFRQDVAIAAEEWKQFQAQLGTDPVTGVAAVIDTPATA